MPYVPVDLDKGCNAGLDSLGHNAQAPLGAQLFHGLPFKIGIDPDRCFIAPTPSSPVTVRVDRRARYVIIAHRLIDSQPPGSHVADYEFVFSDERTVCLPIRARFEIAVVPDAAAVAASPPSGEWGQLPFAARSDRTIGLHPRDTGPWGSAGRRQADVSSADVVPLGYFLWTWENEEPDRGLALIEIRAAGPSFVVAAITTSDEDEYPFVREGARPLHISVNGDALPEISVDRGVASFVHRASTRSTDEYLADPLAGWGEMVDDIPGRAGYAKIAAIPSATLHVKANAATASFAWRDLQEGITLRDQGVTVRLLEPSRNWVRTTVVDGATNEPIPVRVHFRSAEGIPYQPHGHHSHVNGDRETWHIDVGGDVRLGASSYAYIDGTCEGWLPRGDVVVDVTRGFEYEPLRSVVRIEPGQRELTLRLDRWVDLNARGWYSGDSHVHFLSSVGSQIEAQAEGLNVVNLLLSQWGSLFTNAEEFTGQPLVSKDGRTIVYASQENRQHFLGHLSLLGLKRPVMPWASDGPPEDAVGGTLEATLAHWADECHRQGGTVLLPHLPVPNGEPAALVATGRIDAVEFLVQSEYVHSEYYRYLNCGYRLPLVAGTDKMSSEVPVGLYRTYVHIRDGEEFTYDSWCRNLREGRTFITAGPIIDLQVDGSTCGDTVVLPRGGGSVEVEASVESIFPVHTLQLLMSGDVVASTDSSSGTRKLELHEQIRFDRSGWLAVRAGGPRYEVGLRHRDVWERGIIAHTSPVYVVCDQAPPLIDLETVQYMLTLIDGSLTHIREGTLQHPAGTTTHWHGRHDHQRVLEEPFLEARAELHRLLHRAGIPH